MADKIRYRSANGEPANSLDLGNLRLASPIEPRRPDPEVAAIAGSSAEKRLGALSSK